MDALEVSQHDSAASCWLVIHGKVYDVTDYLADHPGGAAMLLKCAGRDATSEYAKVHALSMVEDVLPEDKKLGPLDSATAKHLKAAPLPQQTAMGASGPTANTPLALCVRLADFEPVARGVLPRAAYTYISSAADTLQSHADNVAQWAQVTFVPRVLRDVSSTDLRTRVLGQPSALPVFIVATGLAGLTHADGEAALARAAAARGIHYSPSTYTSVPHGELAAIHQAAVQAVQKVQAVQPPSCGAGSVLFFQLYVHNSREKTLQLIRTAAAHGYQGLMVTVDTPTVGNRDEDRRLKIEEALPYAAPAAPKAQNAENGPAAKDKIVPGSNAGQLSRGLAWADLAWIRAAWPGRLALKGIQSPEDARLAAAAGVDAIYLSNHGGRQLHSAPPCLATLLRIRARCPDVLRRCEVLVDGGALRGGDVLKALCLGATAVGIGRPLLYALGAYGEAGVLQGIDILKHEMETTMPLLGVTRIDQLHRGLVDVSRLARDMEDQTALPKL